MTDLRTELADAEARVAAIKQQLAGATCAEAGHTWKHIGGRNAACSEDCGCSVPVHVCTVCNDSDYGSNAEGQKTIDECETAQLVDKLARLDVDTHGWREMKHPNGTPMFDADTGMMLDDEGGRSIFDDIDA